MHSWIGIALGFAGLALLEGIVSSKRASSNVGGLLAKAGDAVRWFTSPAVPFFAQSSSTQSATTSTTATASPAALSYGATP